eukprot:11817088-Alexandrium_andersonii.AAC.1
MNCRPSGRNDPVTRRRARPTCSSSRRASSTKPRWQPKTCNTTCCPQDARVCRVNENGRWSDPETLADARGLRRARPRK